MARKRIVGLVLCSIGLHGIASAQTDPQSAKDVIAKFAPDLSIPDSPAAAALGITASQVVMPHDPRELAVALSNVSGARSGQGAAFDVSPMLLFAGRSYSIGEYEQSTFLRAAIRTTVGLAGGKKTIAGSDYSGTGISLSTVFLNAGDAVLDQELRKCVNDAQASSVALTAPVKFEKPDTKLGTSEVTEIPIREEDVLNDPKFAADVKRCFSRADAKNWNRSRIAAGFWTTRFDPVTPGLPKATGGNTGWLTLQYGFDGFKPLANKDVDAASRSRSFLDRLQTQGSLVLHYRYTHGASDESQIPATGGFPEVNTQFLATRFTYGSESRAAFAEISRTRQDLQGSVTGRTGGAVGGSFRISKDLWFNVAMGRREDLSVSGTTVSASFKYGTSSEPLVPSR